MLTNNRKTGEYYIQLLKTGANLPESARIELINLLLTLTMLPPTVTLIQRDITPLTAGSGFPHLVKFNGALSAEDERCELQQYKTKMTRITVRLRDEHRAPPPKLVCTNANRLVPAQSCSRTSVSPPCLVPRVYGRPACPGTHAAGGRCEASADLAQRHDRSHSLGR